MPPTPLQSWLGRLSFSFLIIAGLLIYQLWKITSGQVPNQPTWKLILMGASAIVCILLGITGIRLRHRHMD